jgi:hypothetical protein
VTTVSFLLRNILSLYTYSAGGSASLSSGTDRQESAMLALAFCYKLPCSRCCACFRLCFGLCLGRLLWTARMGSCAATLLIPNGPAQCYFDGEWVVKWIAALQNIDLSNNTFVPFPWNAAYPLGDWIFFDSQTKGCLLHLACRIA